MKVYLVTDDLEHVLSIHKTRKGADEAATDFFYSEAGVDARVVEWEVNE